MALELWFYQPTDIWSHGAVSDTRAFIGVVVGDFNSDGSLDFATDYSQGVLDEV
jgi:hypothetical protein